MTNESTIFTPRTYNDIDEALAWLEETNGENGRLRASIAESKGAARELPTWLRHDLELDAPPVSAQPDTGDDNLSWLDSIAAGMGASIEESATQSWQDTAMYATPQQQERQAQQPEAEEVQQAAEEDGSGNEPTVPRFRFESSSAPTVVSGSRSELQQQREQFDWPFDEDDEEDDGTRPFIVFPERDEIEAQVRLAASIPDDPDEAVAWLESLAKRQGYPEDADRDDTIHAPIQFDAAAEARLAAAVDEQPEEREPDADDSPDDDDVTMHAPVEFDRTATADDVTMHAPIQFDDEEDDRTLHVPILFDDETDADDDRTEHASEWIDEDAEDVTMHAPVDFEDDADDKTEHAPVEFGQVEPPVDMADAGDVAEPIAQDDNEPTRIASPLSLDNSVDALFDDIRPLLTGDEKRADFGDEDEEGMEAALAWLEELVSGNDPTIDDVTVELDEADVSALLNEEIEKLRQAGEQSRRNGDSEQAEDLDEALAWLETFAAEESSFIAPNGVGISDSEDEETLIRLYHAERLRAERALAQDDFQQAVAIYDELLASNREGSVEVVLHDVREVVERVHDQPALYRVWGDALAKLERWQEAAKAYRRAFDYLDG